jgi:hypothetical protein
MLKERAIQRKAERVAEPKFSNLELIDKLLEKKPLMEY